MSRVSVIGLGMSYQDLTGHHLSIIRQSDVLIGGVRHLSLFPDFPGEKIEITDNLKDITTFIQEYQDRKKIIVLASGDPLFYGIGGYLSKKLGKDKITIYPNISTISAAFARLNEPWQDAELISLHARQLSPWHIERIRNCSKAAILTDGVRTPEWLWKELKKEGITGFTIWVLEKLGEKDERINSFMGDDITGRKFSDPNIVVLLKDKIHPGLKYKDHSEKCPLETDLHIGMPESRFRHEKGLITKPEIRSITLSKLKLESHHTLWDLGAGSGSVSIEASFFIKTGQIIAVEKNLDRIKDIEYNRQAFAANTIKIVHANLPDGLDTLTRPDRVFIGGGGKCLQELVKQSASVMKKGGIMVVNTVLLVSVTSTLETLTQLNFKTDIVQVQISKGHKMPWNLMLKSQNPVFIISGEKI